MKLKRNNQKEIDTSIDGYAYMGINITQEQLSDLACINTMIKTGTFDDVPVHAMILVLKTLGLLPTEVINNTSCNGGNNDADNNIKESFQRKFGRFED